MCIQERIHPLLLYIIYLQDFIDLATEKGISHFNYFAIWASAKLKLL